jgi:hypothetical protein
MSNSQAFDDNNHLASRYSSPSVDLETIQFGLSSFFREEQHDSMCFLGKRVPWQKHLKKLRSKRSESKSTVSQRTGRSASIEFIGADDQ